MLCQLCKEFLRQLNPLREGWREFESQRIWKCGEAAVAQDCKFCRYTQKILQEPIEVFLKENPDAKKDGEAHLEIELRYSVTHNASRPTPINVELRAEKDGAWIKSMFFDLQKVDSNQELLWDTPGYKISPNTDSEACFALASRWLTTCRTLHKYCERPRNHHSYKWKPTRLIHIPEMAGDLHLVEGDEIPTSVAYATASHCWGNLQDKLILTHENHDSWKRKIPPFGQMKTFEDSVEVARRLGFRYMWIDSLCIIQDSRKDWEAEASLMGNVYKFSSLNISATWAENDTEGCFAYPRLKLRSEEPLRLHFTDMEVTIEPSNTSPYPKNALTCKDGSREPRGKYSLMETPGDWVWDVHRGSVNLRGWVLQERILAPRVLHYTKRQLYWECTELTASETAPCGFTPWEYNLDTRMKRFTPFSIPMNVRNRFLKSGVTLSKEEHEKAVLREAFNIWSAAVQAYTAADLTYETDKFIAISAIARELRQYFKSRYLAGHWENCLIKGLGWRTMQDSTRQKQYRAPSWSWASIDGTALMAQWLRNDETPGLLADLVNVELDLATDDEFGEVKDGSLTLKCFLLELVLKFDADQPDSPIEFVLNVNNNGISMDESLDDTGDPDIWDYLKPRRLWCMPLYFNKYKEIESLLLEEVDPENRVFRRVGHLGFTHKRSPQPPGLCEELEKRFSLQRNESDQSSKSDTGMKIAGKVPSLTEVKII